MVNFIVEITKDEKRCAVVERVSEYTNIWHYFDCLYNFKGVQIACVSYAPSKKVAIATADKLNEFFKRHNKLLTEW